MLLPLSSLSTLLIPQTLASPPPPSPIHTPSPLPQISLPIPNPAPLFAALLATTKQWHESVHHNGLSFFLATIPTGTHLHHGRGTAAPIMDKTIDWLAFEPEHAANFAVWVCEGNDTACCEERGKGDADGDKDESLQHASLKWSWPWAESLSSTFPLAGTRVPADWALPQTRPRGLQNAAAAAAAAQIQLSSNRPTRPPPDDLVVCPGYLHTFTPTRDLRLLYISGMSAAKSTIGTLATQDLILLRHSRFRPRVVMDDWSRAMGLCELAEKDYGGRVDGFVRMEHGFEVILCDFGLLQRDSVLTKGVDRYGNSWWQFLTAVADRYNGVGGSRLKLDTERWVSVLTDENVDVWRDSEDKILPNISRIEDVHAEKIAADVKKMVLESDRTSEGPTVDWKAIAELYVTRYARRLTYLSAKDRFASAKERANATRLIYAAYLDGAEGTGEAAVTRCTNAFIPPPLAKVPQTKRSMSQHAVTAVATEICEALHDIMTTSSNDFGAQQERLEALMDWLRWPEFKLCDHGRGCAVDEVCFIAIWPWGSKADHDEPSCWNQTALPEHMMLSHGYWRMDEPRRPLPKEPHEGWLSTVSAADSPGS